VGCFFLVGVKVLKFVRPIANWCDNEAGELALDKSQVYAVTAEDENGWCTGVNIETGQIGMLHLKYL
jgi:hypothetical protein